MNRLFTGMTDWFGLTDTKAGQRGINAMTAHQNMADAQLQGNVNNAMNQYNQQAGQQLGWYNQRLGDTMAQTPMDFFNPMHDRMTADVTRATQVGAGAGLQSSANNARLATNVGNLSAQNWNSAVQQNLANQRTTADIYNQQLGNNMNPLDTQLQGQLDVAGNIYGGQSALSQGIGQLAGKNQGFFGNIPVLGGLFS